MRAASVPFKESTAYSTIDRARRLREGAANATAAPVKRARRYFSVITHTPRHSLGGKEASSLHFAS